MVEAVFLLTLLAGGLGTAAAPAAAASEGRSSCHISGPTGEVEHVVFLEFDNVHLTRDNPNVPSDLEQMPHLRGFLASNGTLLANDHTALIAHTATDILTSITGLYPDSHGVPVSNSFRYFKPDGSTNFAGSFGYWTAPLTSDHPTVRMIDKQGKNTPAPWVPYTRAGCDFGAVATANTILENNGDISAVFGPGSPEAIEATNNPAQANRDFVGIGVHCAKTGSSVCAGSQHARPDQLPDEPGGYSGFQMLQGHKYVAESTPITAIDNTLITGFPGFDGMSANVTLGYTASLLERGVPVVYGYISDAHDNHTTGRGPFGPGEAGYVQQLKSYDAGFDGFFQRLAKHGMNAGNTLFVFTADEGDHFAGGTPTPAGCDGVNVPCTYPTGTKGEVSANIAGLIATQTGNTTSFKIHPDSAPTVYINTNPGQFSDTTRNLERAFASVTADNPYTQPGERIVNHLADQADMRILHMLTSDPARDMNFTAFGKDWYFLFAGAASCSTPCVSIDPGFAWVHGTISPAINKTWMAFAGPGVRRTGTDSRTWADHVDLRATMMALTGLADDYLDEGRVLYEDLEARAAPPQVRAHREQVLGLQRVLKQLDSPLGAFGVASLRFATAAIETNAPGDGFYRDAVQQLTLAGALRDQLVAAILHELRALEFEGRPVSADRLESLAGRAEAAAEAQQARAEQAESERP